MGSYPYLSQVADVVAQRLLRVMMDRLSDMETRMAKLEDTALKVQSPVDAQDQRIVNLKDPIQGKDAVTLQFLRRYITQSSSITTRTIVAALTPGGGGGGTTPPPGGGGGGTTPPPTQTGSRMPTITFIDNTTATVTWKPVVLAPPYGRTTIRFARGLDTGLIIEDPHTPGVATISATFTRAMVGADGTWSVYVSVDNTLTTFGYDEVSLPAILTIQGGVFYGTGVVIPPINPPVDGPGEPPLN